MKRILIFLLILVFTVTVFALDSSLAEGYAFLDNGVTPHNEADFGFTVREYVEYSNFIHLSGADATEEEMAAAAGASYPSDYIYYFNVDGQSTGENVYNPADGYFYIGIGGFVDNAPQWGVSETEETGSGTNGSGMFFFNYDKTRVAEIKYYGNDGASIVTYLEYAGANHTYDLGDIIFGEAGEPAVPGEGSGSSTGGADATVVVEPIVIGGNSVTPQVVVTPPLGEDITVDVIVAGTATNPGAPNTNLSYTVNVTGNVAGQTLTLVLDYSGYGGTPAHIYYWDGAWMAPLTVDWDTPGANQVTITFPFPAARDGSTEIILGDDDPLPVTLTNFMAQYLNNEFVRVNWTTESESNMYGYRLYRSQSDLDAVEYTSNLIEANNTPQTQVYSFEDYEVRSNETYNYWIEALDMDGTSTMHGPVSVFIDEEIVPELPAQTALKGNYPNPFNPVTNIKFDVKEGEIAELTIYNAKGQLVERESFEAVPGGHVYSWEAADNGSGVYFYRLRSESYNSVKKMIMIK